MSFKIRFAAFALLTAVVFTSCSKKGSSVDDAAKSLAAANEPAMIMSGQIKTLLDKGGISNKENIPMIAQMLLNDKLDYITDPTKAGVDLSGKTYMAFSIVDRKTSGWSVCKMNDKEVFEKMLQGEGYKKFEELEGYNTVVEDNKALMAWNENLLVVVVSDNGNVNETFKTYAAAIEEGKKPAAMYDAFFAANTDIALMTNGNKAIEVQQNMLGVVGGPGTEYKDEVAKKIAAKFKDSYSLFTLNFENDKIVADVKNNFRDAAKKEMNFLLSGGTPKDLLSKIGSDELNGFVSINADIKGFVNWASELTGEDILGEARREGKLDVDRIINSLKGNILISFLGFVKKEIVFGKDENGEDEKFEYTVPRTSVLSTLNDNYLETVADSAMKAKKQPEGYYVIEKGPDMQYVAFTPGLMFFTNDESLLKTPVAVANPKLDAKAMEVMRNPISFYFDLRSFISGADASEHTQKIANKFKITYGGFDISGGHAELIMDNGGKNSLWTLINMGVEATGDAF